MSFNKSTSNAITTKDKWNCRKGRQRKALLILCDVITIFLAHLLSLLLLYNDKILDYRMADWEDFLLFLLVDGVISIVSFWAFKLYRGVWTFASVRELFNVLAASTIAVGAQYGASMAVYVAGCVSIKPVVLFYVLEYFLLISGVGGVRFAYRFLRYIRSLQHNESKNNKTVMVVGAGAAGAAIIRELQTSIKSRYRIACVVDDNPNKWGNYIHGCKIEGGRRSIPALVEQYGVQEIMLAMPAANPQNISEILHICKDTGCKLKTLPGIYQMIDGDVGVSKMRPVEVEDLLGRDPIRVDINGILGYVKDQVVLVTGGGGSIGSELCRQIAAHQPRKLIIFDIYENSTYDIQQELRHSYPTLDLEVLIGSVRNEERLQKVFETYRPAIVYHAAAHKHVPLMEDSPNEAIKNNVFGTYNTAVAAGMYGAKRFVLISTDKAVNPTNIMGASKRLCEMVVQMMNHRYDTEFVAVRFGNVLGSNGSVIPLFRKQIERGGPVTVTHPDIIRYFMTIPEAVSLVLQAGAYAKGGEIFVLDMGRPVKIVDLARNLILLSGFKPDIDITIEYTGLRPGEKLYEEMLMDEEGMSETENKLIFIGQPIRFDRDEFEEGLQRLKKAAYEETEDIRSIVAELVPTYKPKEKTEKETVTQ